MKNKVMEIIFDKGIPGFEEFTKYEILDIEEFDYFYLLQSLEDEELGFILTNPFNTVENYEFKINEKDRKYLHIEDYRDVLVLCIVTIGENIEQTTINLRAPIVINIKNLKAHQLIIDNDIYDLKHKLLKEC